MNRAFERGAEISEAGMVIRFCAARLSAIERHALSLFLAEATERDGASVTGLTRGGVWMAKQRALWKMREQLEALGIESSADLISENS